MDGTSSLKEWYEEQDKKSPGVSRLTGEMFKVGNRVDVWHHGEWVVGTIIAKRSNGSKFDIIYDDGDEENDVDPLFMRFEMKETPIHNELRPRRATDQLKVLSDANLALTIKYNKLKEDCKAIKEEVEKLKQEKESHIRLIDELSREQRSTIKAGTRKNVRSRTKRVRYV